MMMMAMVVMVMMSVQPWFSAAVVSAVRECERLRDLMWGGYIKWVEESGSALVPGHCHYTGGGNEVSWIKYLHHLLSLSPSLSLAFITRRHWLFFFFYTFLWACCENPWRVGSWPILPCKVCWTVSLLNILLSHSLDASRRQRLAPFLHNLFKSCDCVWLEETSKSAAAFDSLEQPVLDYRFTFFFIIQYDFNRSAHQAPYQSCILRGFWEAFGWWFSIS